MVVGTIKASAIQKEPLLAWNSSIFKKVLHSGDRTLAVIGYSFRDEHINDVIADGIERHALRLIVVNTQLPENFRAQMIGTKNKIVHPGIRRGNTIWEGLIGYYVLSGNQYADASWVGSTVWEPLMRRLELIS